MHIEELHLQNFRGFQELKLKLPPDLAVFIGSNGSGKSSILDSIAILLSRFIFELLPKKPYKKLDFDWKRTLPTYLSRFFAYNNCKLPYIGTSLSKFTYLHMCKKFLCNNWKCFYPCSYCR